MATVEEVQKLASLARIQVSEEELPKFVKEFEAILAYVGQLERLDLPADLQNIPASRNVFRADENQTPAGTWTERVTQAFPEREGNALAVKQIITHE